MRPSARTLEDRQSELKQKNKLKRKTNLNEESLIAKINECKAEIKRWQTKKAELEHRLENLISKKYETYIASFKKVEKKKDLCPMCETEHISSPPDECWIKAHGLKESRPVNWEAFHNYLVSHRWGSLKM